MALRYYWNSCNLENISTDTILCPRHKLLFTKNQQNTKKEPDNSYLVSLDERSLYTSIRNSEGIKAVKTSLENFPTRTTARLQNGIIAFYLLFTCL